VSLEYGNSDNIFLCPVSKRVSSLHNSPVNEDPASVAVSVIKRLSLTNEHPEEVSGNSPRLGRLYDKAKEIVGEAIFNVSVYF
jgi:hypothetical protein